MPRGRFFFGPGFWKWGWGPCLPGWRHFRAGLHGTGWWWGGGPVPVWGYHPWAWPETMPREEEIDFLKQQADALRAELKEIEERLKEIEDTGD